METLRKLRENIFFIKTTIKIKHSIKAGEKDNTIMMQVQRGKTLTNNPVTLHPYPKIRNFGDETNFNA